MASFDVAQQIVKINEGGYSDDMRDRGNFNNIADFNAQKNVIGTHYGISAPVFSTYLGHPATKAESQNMTYDTALKIYKKNFWDIMAGDQIDNQSLANLIYDTGVLHGTPKTYKWVAAALDYPTSPTRFPYPQDLVEKINTKSNQQKLFDTIKQNRINSYSQSSVYYKGWMNRVNKFFYGASQEVKKKSGS